MEIETATRDIGPNFLFPSYVSDKKKKKKKKREKRESENNVYSVVRRSKITCGKVAHIRML